ncbi:hypothetical protein LEMLEM_LOCUS24450, partial [Lemmus lemmus]
MSTEDTGTPAGQSVTSRLEAVDSGVWEARNKQAVFAYTDLLIRVLEE